MSVWHTGVPEVEVLATGIVPWLLLAISSTVVFAIHGAVNYAVGLVMSVGLIGGAWIGARFAVKRGEPWIKAAFVGLVLVAAGSLLVRR
jgi:uncharacterized membrane protein YfcA